MTGGKPSLSWTEASRVTLPSPDTCAPEQSLPRDVLRAGVPGLKAYWMVIEALLAPHCVFGLANSFQPSTPPDSARRPTLSVGMGPDVVPASAVITDLMS